MQILSIGAGMQDLHRRYARFQADALPRRSVAVHMELHDRDEDVPVHQHKKGELFLALHGAATCSVPHRLWMVPPGCGLWIPNGVPHSNWTSKNGRFCLLFVEPGVASLPGECCMLSIAPFLRELILHLAELPLLYAIDGPTDRLVTVLLDELAAMPKGGLHLPISADRRLRRITEALIADPSDRSTVAMWASRVAMSERSFARFIVAQTGMTFGRWRRQLHIIVALQRLSAGASVHNVSEALGYESVGAFITMFKKALGQSPRRYLRSTETWLDARPTKARRSGSVLIS